MSTLAVARKDFRDAIRSRSLIALVAVFTIFSVAATYLVAEVLNFNTAEGVNPALGLFVSLITPIVVLVPLIGVMSGYKSIVGERESGSANLLLALPHTRRDVVAGKTIGRIVVLAVAIVIGFAISAVVAFALYDTFPLGKYVLFTLLTIVLGVVYMVFAIGLSAATASTSVALWGSLGFFALFQFLWGFVLNLVVYVVHGFSTPDNFNILAGYFSFQEQVTPPNWYRLLQAINPGNAYQNALGTFFTNDINLGIQSQSVPYYLEGWFAFVILAIWLVVPLVLGYLRFQRSDL